MAGSYLLRRNPTLSISQRDSKACQWALGILDVETESVVGYQRCFMNNIIVALLLHCDHFAGDMAELSR